MADFDPSGSQNSELILMKLGMIDYFWDPTPRDNIGGGSTTWVVCGLGKYVTCLISEFLFFFF